MATFGKLIREGRLKIGMNQSEFGKLFDIIMTDISKIENNRKKFPFSKLKQLSNILKIDYTALKDRYIADKLVDDVKKYDCTSAVFAVAEEQMKDYSTNKQKAG